ncbi:hypothetical protein BGX28_010443 [Mortierella sp. GBA30]|nr:hypothetical protein BGX28_010443 [Mortierella sp. GBA30]
MSQLQRAGSATSAMSDAEGVMYSSAMDATGANLSQDWISPSADYNNLTSLGFDTMFQFNGNADPFPIDHTEFASNDFGFPQAMVGPVSSGFDTGPSSNGMMGPNNVLEGGATGGMAENNGFHGMSSSNGGDGHIHGLGLGQDLTDSTSDSSRNSSSNSNSGPTSGNGASINADSGAGNVADQGEMVNLNMALKPHYMKSLKAAASAATTAPSNLALQHHQQQQQQGFNLAHMDMSPTETGMKSFSGPTMFRQRPGQEQALEQHSQSQHHSFSVPHEHNPPFQHHFQQQVQSSSRMDEDGPSQQHNPFSHNRPLSMSGVSQQQQQFEDMLLQQQQQLSTDMKGHFRHSSSPSLSELVKQESPLLQRSRAEQQQQQMQLHHHQESMKLSQQQQQQQQQSVNSSSIHPFSAGSGVPSKSGIPARTLTKRPSDLHVDISGRSSSFRLSGDVRNGDFRFGNDGRDPNGDSGNNSNSSSGNNSVSAPLSPSNSSMAAPLTPAFFSPAFGEALGSPSSILYQNSPFILGSQHDRSRASIQTDTSMGSFMDLHASSASSPSSLGSLHENGHHRMFRASTDSMHTMETVTPMDIACNFSDMSSDMNGFLEKQDLGSASSSASLQHRRSFCHSPDHIDPHSVEVKPTYFSTTFRDESQYTHHQQHIKMELMSTPEIDHDHVFRDGSVPEASTPIPVTPTGSVKGESVPPQPQSQPKTARKRRSNEAVSAYSPATSSSPNSSSPPRPARSRTISTTSSLLDEKEEPADPPRSSFYASHGSMRPIMLTQDIKPPSSKTMRTVIKHFLQAKTPSQGGEKTVLILTSKVAQKSYGTEKRFLCPPPTTMLLGSNWWSAPQPHNQQSSSEDSSAACVPTPPKMIVSICGEAGSQQGVIDWTATKDEAVAPIITGKCVSKQLYINDADEKRKKVEVLVKFMMAGDLELGTFASKPIKVISKPSKKRQSIKNMELCIHHGTTISLFNRIRSQTVSTKYLGVSTTTQASAHAPWNYGTNNLKDWPNLEPSPESSANPVNTDGGTCFVARTGSWDPFVVWIVSPGQTRTETLQEHSQRHPGFPPPPAIAINSPPENGPQTPIHYNQPIVLQCLSTGLVSPVMVIRKVDKGSMVLGGGSVGHASAEYDQEAIGDPVSQLHKVAFQITGQSAPVPFSQSKLQQGTYLACLGDVVGMQRANEGKRYLPDPKATGHSAANDNSHANGNGTGGVGTFPMEIVPEIPESNSIPEVLMSAWSSADDKAVGLCHGADKTMMTTADGQRVERKRRVSSSVVIKSVGSIATKTATAKSRRRVNSMSVTQAEAQRIRASAMAANSQHHHNSIHAYIPTALNGGDKEKAAKESHTSAKVLALQQQRRNSSIWTEDVTDAAVWTIVGTDCAQYNFCTPGGNEAMSLPRTPVTPTPKVMEICLNGQPSGSRAATGPISINSISHSNGSNSNNNGSSGSGNNEHGYGQSKGAKVLRVMEPNMNGQERGHPHDGYHQRNGSTCSMFNSTLPARFMTLKGYGFGRDLTVWFGTIKAPVTEYQNPETLVAQVPEEVSLGSTFYFTKDDDEDEDEDEDEDDASTNGGDDSGSEQQQQRFRRKRVKGLSETDCVPILLVRKDGVIFRSGHSITLG